MLFQELPSVMLPVENGNIFPYSPEVDSPAADGTAMPSKIFNHLNNTFDCYLCLPASVKTF